MIKNIIFICNSPAKLSVQKKKKRNKLLTVTRALFTSWRSCAPVRNEPSPCDGLDMCAKMRWHFRLLRSGLSPWVVDGVVIYEGWRVYVLSKAAAMRTVALSLHE